jgi:MFS family permease
MAVNSPLPSDGKVEVSSLPPAGPASGARDDLSAGTTGDISALLAEDIKDRQQLRRFQTVAFYSAGLLIGVTFVALFLWVYLIGTHVTDANVSTTYRVSFFVAPIVVLATLGALLALAVLKFAFRASEKKDDEPTPISLLQALVTQTSDILKTYLGKKGD